MSIFSLLCPVRRTHRPANGPWSNEHHGQACSFRASFNWIPLTYCPLLSHGTIHPPSLATAPSSSGPAHSTPVASLPHLAPRPPRSRPLVSARPDPSHRTQVRLRYRGGRFRPPSDTWRRNSLGGVGRATSRLWPPPRAMATRSTIGRARAASVRCCASTRVERNPNFAKLQAGYLFPEVRRPRHGNACEWMRRGTCEDVARDACTWEKVEAKGPEEKSA